MLSTFYNGVDQTVNLGTESTPTCNAFCSYKIALVAIGYTAAAIYSLKNGRYKTALTFVFVGGAGIAYKLFSES